MSETWWTQDFGNDGYINRYKNENQIPSEENYSRYALKNTDIHNQLEATITTNTQNSYRCMITEHSSSNCIGLCQSVFNKLCLLYCESKVCRFLNMALKTFLTSIFYTSSWLRLLLFKMLYLQRGQVALIYSHLSTQTQWKWWPQGSSLNSTPSS